MGIDRQNDDSRDLDNVSRWSWKCGWHAMGRRPDPTSIVRISAPVAEGRVIRGYKGLDVGERVRVELIDADVERGFIDFAAVGSPS